MTLTTTIKIPEGSLSFPMLGEVQVGDRLVPTPIQVDLPGGSAARTRPAHQNPTTQTAAAH